MPCDGMPVRYVLGKPYHILVLTRNDWSSLPLHSGGKCSVWYTDGSKMDKGIDAVSCLMGFVNCRQSNYPFQRKKIEKKKQMLKKLHVSDIICQKVWNLSIVSKITAYLCSQSWKKGSNFMSFCKISASLWNQWKKVIISKNQLWENFMFQKQTTKMYKLCGIFAETILYKWN